MWMQLTVTITSSLNYSYAVGFTTVHHFLIEFEVCSQKDKGSVRLTGLNSSFVGYVQVCRNGHWTAVSFEAEEEWTKKNSIVTCKELGFIGAIIVMNKDRSAFYLWR